jgi:hypothetical protein
MTILKTYADFLKRVETAGFLPLSPLLPGLPSLSDETSKASWHTGDPETDPWQWKDRAAAEKHMAYGCVLNGQKGFIAPRLYASFFAACHPMPAMPDRWETGEIPQAVWDVWQLFEKKPALSTSDIRKQLGVTQKQGGSRVDAALVRMQQEFYITVAGNRRKISKEGQPFGWPSSFFERVSDWAPAEWLGTPAGPLPAQAAWKNILSAASALAPTLPQDALARVLGYPV